MAGTTMIGPPELYAWVREDELGSGEYGIKHGLVPAGYIPLVAIKRDIVQRLKPRMEDQARRYGRQIRLVRYIFYEVVDATTAGK